MRVLSPLSLCAPSRRALAARALAPGSAGHRRPERDSPFRPMVTGANDGSTDGAAPPGRPRALRPRGFRRPPHRSPPRVSPPSL